jgi:hypothetical protein
MLCLLRFSSPSTFIECDDMVSLRAHSGVHPRHLLSRIPFVTESTFPMGLGQHMWSICLRSRS